MSIISQMAEAVNAKLADVMAARNSEYKAETDAFVSALDSFLSTLDSTDETLGQAIVDRHAAHKSDMGTAITALNGKIAGLKANADAGSLDSLAEVFAEIARVNESLDAGDDFVSVRELINAFTEYTDGASRGLDEGVGTIEEVEAAFAAAGH